MSKINTTHVYPPIPDRRFDWQATYDDDEPNDNGSMASGHGRTEQEAIADLLENHPRNEDDEQASADAEPTKTFAESLAEAERPPWR